MPLTASIGKIALKINHSLIIVAICYGFGVQPINDSIFERVGEEVISHRAVMPDVVSLHVILDGKIETPVIFQMNPIHVEISQSLFVKIVHNLLLVTRLPV